MQMINPAYKVHRIRHQAVMSSYQISQRNPNDTMFQETVIMLQAYTDSNRIIYRNYTTVSAVNQPLDFSIRLNDNLDASYSRLTGPQRDPLLQLYLLRVYQDGPLRNLFIETGGRGNEYNTAMVNAKVAALNLVRGYDSTWTDNPSTPTGQITSNIIITSFLFFYSVYITQDLLFSQGILYVDLYKQDYSSLTYSNHVGAALYQINRLAVSMHSCYLTPTQSFLNSVLVNLNPELLPINRTQPLRAFAQKPTYNETGIIPLQLICGYFNGTDCNTAVTELTISTESCLFSDPSTYPASGSCCNFTGLQLLITDLSFPTNQNQVCPVDSEFPMWIIITICVVVGLILFIFIAIGLFLTWRQRTQHRTIDEYKGLISDEHKSYA